jgi:hypothetical protein
LALCFDCSLAVFAAEDVVQAHRTRALKPVTGDQYGTPFCFHATSAAGAAGQAQPAAANFQVHSEHTANGYGD